MKLHLERYNPPVCTIPLTSLSQEHLEKEWYEKVDRRGLVDASSATYRAGTTAAQEQGSVQPYPQVPVNDMRGQTNANMRMEMVEAHTVGGGGGDR